MTGERELLGRIAREVREYRGLTRKRCLKSVASLIPDGIPDLLAARGEDGAVIAVGERKLILAADGVMEEIIGVNPRWAGYCSVLVNINDILAMRGHPIAAVNTISVSDEKTIGEIVAGMRDACEKFGVMMVGGHVHPDASVDSISVAALGEIVTGEPLLSTTARPGESILVICDCSGDFTPGVPYSWDCTSMRNADEIGEIMKRVTDALGFFSSGKDVSNPGLLGTLGMLLEASTVGGTVNIGDIPMPAGADIVQWLTCYQGMGFVGTAKEELIDQIVGIIDGTDLSVAFIGSVTDRPVLKLRLGENQETLFDLTRDKITGLF